MDLDSVLHVIRRRWQRCAALDAVARALALAAAILGAAAIAERLLQPSDVPLLLLAAAAALSIAAGAAWTLWPLRRRFDDRQIARFIEERVPELDDAIVTAVDIQQRMRRGAEGTAFAPLVVAGAAARLRTIDPEQIVDRERMARGMRRAAGASAALLLALAVARPFVEKSAQVAYVKLFPSSVVVHVASGDMRIPAGRSVTIAASVAGRRIALGRIAPVVILESAGGATTVPMQAAGGGYELRIPQLERSFKYRVTAGPARSNEYSVTALLPARVQRIELRYEYPTFTGLAPRREPDGGDVFGPAGTRVTLVVHSDKPISGGRLAFAEAGTAVELAKVSERALESTLTLKEEASYRVRLQDVDGLTSEGVEYFVRVMDDRPPTVHILRPTGDQQITPLEEVPIEARADDDFGIASLDMVYSVAGGPEQAVPFTSLGGTDVARIGSRMLAAEDLKVKPGDVIAYYARARDVPRAKRSTLARSEIFFLEVKPFNEEYSLAQSQAGMQSAAGAQLEGLIAAQKEIISATWNLERRAAAGRSPSDVKDVADAQAELKARAEQAAGAARQRRRFGGFLQIAVGQPPAAPASGDPVSAAVAAMSRALQHLQTQKTADAIPHEMAALNALLQAQAEIRKREVSQQQNNAGGAGGNRQSQDLSNLFDRELKRQQKTNYETKAQVESQPETGSDAAMDKIRDLARRQEELSRRQRELAGRQLSEEERRRELEKLTREQEDLRRQAEQASRDAKGAEGARGAKGAGADAAGGSSQELSRALEQMRQAAEQGNSGNAAGAAAKGEEAARQLRQAESRMQNGSPDARRRALGDVQLESQQIADAQRRIASEADRLDREGGGASDARRRLAGEKERLADRVDALQQAAQRIGAEGARDLAAQKLGERMRASAGGMREGTPGRLAPAEQQIADALDKVARKLNGADAGGAKGDTEQLAGQLDELRDARERLSRLEKQIAEAARAADGSRGRGSTPSQPGRAGRQGPEGRQGERGSGGGGSGGDLQQLQQAYNRELQRTRELMDRARGSTPQSGAGTATPEQHEWSRSAPGTEAFKQDYAAWQALASDVARALERTESAVAGRLAGAVEKDRLRAGGSERVPDAYQRRVSKYFEAIAVKKNPGDVR
ncbi:MAG TPA: DUF4175 family protein [Vicinamibacterales bacterium]|nr:DUF4175 family protein [Vicinamibacterales bacterium]